jgi:2-haloacid dehalogenase
MQPQYNVPSGIKVFVFDAYGTVFDLHSALTRHPSLTAEQAHAFSNLWRTKQLEYSWVTTLAGHWRNFWEVTADSLDYALTRFPDINPASRGELLQAYRKLSAYSDAQKTLIELRSKGYRTAILSNGETTMLRDAVTSAGLEGYFDHVWSVDVLRHYKPHPDVYQLAVRDSGFSRAELCLISSNRWDIAGALAFGLRAIWVNRLANPSEYTELAPDATVASLEEVPGLLDY